MNKVNVLSDHLANLIAAGEVVLDPKSVIKELVENSIDANANIININVDEAGFNSIVVDDNGEGMSHDDALASLKRHATSKIKTQIDLNNITTMGFRGEALPSIASVSYFEIETGNGVECSKIVVQGGKLISNELIENQIIGTKISVRNLFYNTPARLKHQVTPRYQLSQIKEYIYQMSLIYQDIKFNLSSDGVLIYSSFEGDLVGNVAQIHGIEVAKNLVLVENESMDFEIDGFYIDPKYSKSNKKSMWLSINNRLIWSNTISNAIIDALNPYLMVNRYPICFFNINIDTSLIDVNVHPQKRLVKISKEDELVKLLYNVISEKILSSFSVFEASVNADTRKENKDIEYKQSTISDFTNHSVKSANDKVIIMNSNLTEDDVFTSSDVVYDETLSKFGTIVSDNRNSLPEITYIGQYDNSYIIGQIEDKLVLIDQHAAMERINYEKYLKKLKVDEKYVTKLVIPIEIKLTIEEVIILEEKKDILSEFALTFETFSQNSILVREIPSYVTSRKIEKFLNMVFALVINDKSITKEKLLNEIAIIKACKLSLKANQRLDKYESTMLFEQLYYVENYTSCPHGRPLIVSLSRYEIEKLFKRIV